MSGTESSASTNSTNKDIEHNCDNTAETRTTPKEELHYLETDEQLQRISPTIVATSQQDQVIPTRLATLELDGKPKPRGSSATLDIIDSESHKILITAEQQDKVEVLSFNSDKSITIEGVPEVRISPLIKDTLDNSILKSCSKPAEITDGKLVKSEESSKELIQQSRHWPSEGYSSILHQSISTSPERKSKSETGAFALISAGDTEFPTAAANYRSDSVNSGTEGHPFCTSHAVPSQLTQQPQQENFTQAQLRLKTSCTMSSINGNNSFHRQQQQQLRQLHETEGQTFVIRPNTRRVDSRHASSVNNVAISSSASLPLSSNNVDFVSDSRQPDDMDNSSNIIGNASMMQENETSSYHPIGHPRNVASVIMQPPSSSSSVASSIGASLHNNANNLINMQFDGPETGHNLLDHGETYEDDNFNDIDNDYNAGTWIANNRNSATSSSSCGWTDVMGAATTTSNAAGGAGAGATMMPSPRSLHSAAILNGVLYVFGGYDGNQRVNSFHAYTFADKRWSPVLPSQNSGNPPSPRDRHVSVAFGNSFYVHGGFDGTARDASLFSFDFSTMAWREVIASFGRPPSARHSHAAVVHDHSMYIFGGYDGSYKSDLHEFDFTSSRWNSVPAVGRRPRPRYRATCVVYKNCMILYGGHDGTRHLSDTFTFDFDTLTWNALLTDGTQPIPRDSHVSVIHGNSMYVFGGSSGVAMNDFHELQLPIVITNAPNSANSSNTVSSSGHHSSVARWRPIHTTTSATARSDGQQYPRHRFCHVAVTYNDSMYVFGGYDGADRLNSFIRFDFAVYDLSFEIPSSTLVQDFRSLVNNQKLSDITFIVQDQPIYAHKLMLMRCSYFQALFSGNMRESNMDTIRIEQVRYPIFLGILEYLYTDQVRTIPFHTAMEYFEAADLFCIPRLKTICEKVMLQNITQSNAASIFHAADLHSATALREKAKKYILNHFEDVSKTSSFEDMGRQNVDLVFELLHSR